MAYSFFIESSHACLWAASRALTARNSRHVQNGRARKQTPQLATVTIQKNTNQTHTHAQSAATYRRSEREAPTRHGSNRQLLAAIRSRSVSGVEPVASSCTRSRYDTHCANDQSLPGILSGVMPSTREKG